MLLIDLVTPSARKVLRDAFDRYVTYATLLETANKQWRKGAVDKKTFIQLEAEQIKALIGFEIQRNKKNKSWNFENEGIHRLTDDFFLLNEYLAFLQGPRFKEICNTWGRFLLKPEQTAGVNALPDAQREDKVVEILTPTLRPVWSYFMALCHVLQTSDYYLTALDAFWLGLVDEIIGERGLPTLRIVGEQGSELGNDEEEGTTTPEAPLQITEGAAGA